MNDKKCTKCKKTKLAELDFYLHQGSYRSQCKACIIQRNSRRQKKLQPWKHRFVDEVSRKEYAKEYYAKNRERFATYRREFKKRNPEYYKMYARERKNKKDSGELVTPHTILF